jgi:hypothetical protein
VTLHSLRQRALLVAPIRLALGVVWLAAARLAGAGGAQAVLAFVVGALGIVLAAFVDPRARLAQGPLEPLEAPPDAVVAPRWRQALAATIPSTVGVSILAAIALAPQPTLAALLGGVSAGLGLAALIAAPSLDRALYVDPRSRVVYHRR